jgi:hypothetical protein
VRITTIGFTLPAACSVALKVYDIMGSEVATMNDKYETAGFHTFTFDASETAGRHLLLLRFPQEAI